MHQDESTWLKVRNDSKSPDGRGLPIRGPQRPSPYADGVRGGLVVLKSQVSLFSVCADGLVTVVPECCSEPLTGFHASD